MVTKVVKNNTVKELIKVLQLGRGGFSGMDPRKLKKEFGDQLCFWGGIDTQEVLPYGSVKDVEEEVKRRIDELAPGGGYILGPVHNIQPDVPPENICAMYKTTQKYGKSNGTMVKR